MAIVVTRFNMLPREIARTQEMLRKSSAHKRHKIQETKKYPDTNELDIEQRYLLLSSLAKKRRRYTYSLSPPAMGHELCGHGGKT